MKDKQGIKQLFASLLFSAICVQMFAFSIHGQLLKTSVKQSEEIKKQETSAPVEKYKIAPDLEEKTNELSSGLRADETQKVIIRLKSDTPLDEMFGNSLSPVEQKRLLEQEVENTRQKARIVSADLAEADGNFEKAFYNLGMVVAELPLSKLRRLAESEAVEYISPEKEIKSFGHLGTTTGWKNDGIAYYNGEWLTGSVGHVVVIDSGIDQNHALMKWNGTNQKIKYSRDFTGQNITGDPYGHGTHVASMLAADYSLHGAAYEAPANASNIISLRVLDSVGQGSVSNLIAALDWCVANKTAWNIRVINISLGTGVSDSYKNDPLCLAARRAVNAGIVVVASAGNYGKDAVGNKLYGGISSPGIEPSVITVGAANSFGTDGRNDDTVATFSSRGPTRGYVTLQNGARKYDNLIKPDLIAPGNKLIGGRAYYNGTENYLARTNPSLRTGTDILNTEKVMYLSGTSMAAPQVAGAALLLIQTNPNLTPNLVKAILMYSAQPLDNFSTLEQGAGELNIDGAVRIARLVKPTMPMINGTPLLNASLPLSQTSVIAGQTVYWGKGVITNFGFLYGNDLMNKWQGMYANGVLVSDATPFSGSSISKSSAMTYGSLSLYQGAIKNNGVLVSDGTLYLSSNAMGGSPSPTINSEGVLVSDGVLVGDGVLVSDGVLVGDGGAMSANAMRGDNTYCMQPAN